MKHSTVAVIGIGAVGSTIAYTLILRNIVSEIILIDIDEKKCMGEVKDLSDVLPFSSASNVKHGIYSDAKKADIIIISAGKAQKPGQTRIDLLKANKQIFKAILDNLTGINPNALIIVVANPLDLLTWYAHQHLAVARSQIFGMGTFLDTQRLKHHLGSIAGVAEDSIQAFVLGEHGDSQMVAWSATSIGGMGVDHWGIFEAEKEKIALSVKNEAYEIIKAKGATFYGIAACVATVCEIVIFNKKLVVPLSWYHEDYDVCMSLPVVLSEKGVERVLNLDLTKEEKRLLSTSADVLRGYYSSFEDT